MSSTCKPLSRRYSAMPSTVRILLGLAESAITAPPVAADDGLSACLSPVHPARMTSERHREKLLMWGMPTPFALRDRRHDPEDFEKSMHPIPSGNLCLPP